MSTTVRARFFLDDGFDNARSEFNKAADETGRILPATTCGDIDKVIAAFKQCEKFIGRADDERYDTAKELSDDFSREVWGLEDELERVRTANSRLRALSEQWRDVAETCLAEVEALHEAASLLRNAILFSVDTMTFEINPSNYSHDDACILNAQSIEAFNALQNALEEVRDAS